MKVRRMTPIPTTLTVELRAAIAAYESGQPITDKDIAEMASIAKLFDDDEEEAIAQ